MDDIQAQMGAILNDPDMMQKIMAMAQSLGGNTQQAPQQAPQQATDPVFGGFDPGMLQKLAGVAQQSGIDSNQKNLLQALAPYLSGDRIGRLEKAMRAAKMARLAAATLGGNFNLTG